MPVELDTLNESECNLCNLFNIHFTCKRIERNDHCLQRHELIICGSFCCLVIHLFIYLFWPSGLFIEVLPQFSWLATMGDLLVNAF